MSQSDLQTRLTPEGLLIVGGSDGDGLGQSVDAWRVTKLANRRLLVFADKSAENPSAAYGVANCSSEMLYDLLFGLNHRRWSGMVVVDVGFAKKKLYFSGGECVFAASDLMDDRLGEVIYREAIISMEQLANFAVQVDRKTKFGQVLLKSGEFNNTDLWNALKYQVRDVFFSVFLAERSYLEVYPNSAPVEIAFEEGTESLLETAFSYGSQFRAFKSRILAPSGPCRRLRHGHHIFSFVCQLSSDAARQILADMPTVVSAPAHVWTKLGDSGPGAAKLGWTPV
jgi:hypothetical protein